MKRSLYVASCVLLASAFLSSCQKEDKSALDLAHELTAELQQITDLPTANAHAARVEALNKRFQDASVRVLALNATALRRSADEGEHKGASYADALKALAKEIGRVRASYPTTTHDGAVDRDRLLLAIGAANGGDTADRRKEIGLSFVHDDTGAHEIPGTFPEYYGSAKLQEALAYRANAATASNVKFDSAADVPAIPSVGAVAEEESPSAAAGDDAPAAEDKDDADSTPAAEKSDDDAPAAADDDDDDNDTSAADDEDSDDEDE